MKMRSINRLILFLSILFTAGETTGQGFMLAGKVVDSTNNTGLASVTISIYANRKLSGTVSNKEGLFSLYVTTATDSVKFSMIGHKSKVFSSAQLAQSPFLEVALEILPVELPAIIVNPLTAVEIMEKAVTRLPSSQPSGNFETGGFYREIIKDRDNYFSVAEALFNVQFFPAKKAYKLKLDKGRTKEDVTYTALFENYHPGGGPQQAIENSFLTGVPFFLKQKGLKKFDFKREKNTYHDGKLIYVIAFDQKKGVKELLEKGRIFIDAGDFSVIRYEAETSPARISYIKHLTGTDKMFAGLLGIDFKRKGWKREVEFIKANDKWLLNHAEMEVFISFKQPKKNLDLDLTITLELLLNPEQNLITKEIDKNQEWERKQLARNLPFAFDPVFWGSASSIQPTQKISDVIATISLKNNDLSLSGNVSGWNKYKETSFGCYQHDDSISLIPTINSRWLNDKNGPLLFREVANDFSIETKLDISKRADNTSSPDRGFQQCGIIIRVPDDARENYLSLTVGTNGNRNNKLLFTKTVNGKSKSFSIHIERGSYWLKLEKKGNKISSYKKSDRAREWELIKTYETGWEDKKLQAGLIGFADFAGNGPHMTPDIKGVFSRINITML